MTRDNNSKGIILIIIAMTLFAMQDSLIKYIFEKAALYEIFFGRYFVAAVLLFIYVKFKREKVSLKTYYPFLTLFRVLLHFIAFSAFFISLTYMPLATPSQYAPLRSPVIRMQQGSFNEVAEDFTTCIHCGLCRFVCEDKVKPHNMGLWIRRSLGKSQQELQAPMEDANQIEKEWQYLLVDDKQERLQRARKFRESRNP